MGPLPRPSLTQRLVLGGGGGGGVYGTRVSEPTVFEVNAEMTCKFWAIFKENGDSSTSWATSASFCRWNPCEGEVHSPGARV